MMKEKVFSPTEKSSAIYVSKAKDFSLWTSFIKKKNSNKQSVTSNPGIFIHYISLLKVFNSLWITQNMIYYLQLIQSLGGAE